MIWVGWWLLLGCILTEIAFSQNQTIPTVQVVIIIFLWPVLLLQLVIRLVWQKL